MFLRPCGNSEASFPLLSPCRHPHSQEPQVCRQWCVCVHCSRGHCQIQCQHWHWATLQLLRWACVSLSPSLSHFPSPPLSTHSPLTHLHHSHSYCHSSFTILEGTSIHQLMTIHPHHDLAYHITFTLDFLFTYIVITMKELNGERLSELGKHGKDYTSVV